MHSDIQYTPAPERAAWKGADLRDRATWVEALSPAEKQELCEVSSKLPAEPSEWLRCKVSDLPLPLTSVRLARVADEIEHGRGFAVVSGVPVMASVAQTSRIHWLLGLHLGRIVPQNGKGELIGQVRDLGSNYATDVNARGYTSSDEMTFHCDAADVVSLLCLRTAKEGGRNSVVSSLSVHNAALEEREFEILDALYRGFRVYMRDDKGSNAVLGTTRAGEVSDVRFPVFSEHAGRLSGGLNLKSVASVPLVTGKPFDDLEQRAFDFVSRTVERDDLKLDIDLGPGDWLLLNNLTVLHKRSRFIDHEEPEKKRLLLRLWLNLYNGRPLPDHLDRAVRHGFDVPPVVNAPVD